jgi:hypothetical protein
MQPSSKNKTKIPVVSRKERERKATLHFELELAPAGR